MVSYNKAKVIGAVQVSSEHLATFGNARMYISRDYTIEREL
jgi:hypothetical protein